MKDHTILWRRLDQPGHESCRLSFRDSEWRLAGTAVFAHEGRACRLDYLVACDASWQTVSGRVTGWVGEEDVTDYPAVPKAPSLSTRPRAAVYLRKAEVRLRKR